MKRIFSFFVCLSILCVLTVPAFADDETDSTLDSGSSVTDTSGPSSPAESPPSAPTVDTSEPVPDSSSSSVDTVSEAPEVPAAPVEDVTPIIPVDPPAEDVPSIPDAPSADDVQVPTDPGSDVFVDDSASIPGFDEGILYPDILFEETSPSFTPYSVYSLDDDSSVSAYSLEDAESLSSVITALFGEYQPRTQTVTDYLSDGSSVTYQQYVPGLAGLDYEWLTSVSLFALALYCILRMIGGALKWS